MELLEAIRTRRTSNGPFRPDPVKIEHQRLLIEAASHAPSHFNSQPWRFVLPDATGQKRPRIDWTSSHRKRLSQLVYRDRVSPENSWPE